MIANLQAPNLGQPGATGPSGAIGMPPNNGGMRLSSLEVDADGNPKAHLSPSTMKTWALAPDGQKEIGYDDLGRPMATRPVRAEEDKPLGTSGAKDMVDASGKSPPPTMSARDAIARGYSMKEDKIPLSDSARLALANEGARSIQQIRDRIAPGGKVDKALIFKMDVPFGGIGEGRVMNQLADTALAGQILLQSGVSVRPDEVTKLRQTYIPTMGDLSSEGLAEKKLTRFQALLEGNIDMASLPPSIRARVEARRAAGNATNSPTNSPEMSAVNPQTGERLVLRNGKWVKP
jgi:hypothetical protein